MWAMSRAVLPSAEWTSPRGERGPGEFGLGISMVGMRHRRAHHHSGLRVGSMCENGRINATSTASSAALERRCPTVVFEDISSATCVPRVAGSGGAQRPRVQTAQASRGLRAFNGGGVPAGQTSPPTVTREPWRVGTRPLPHVKPSAWGAARSVCWQSGCRVLRKQDASCVWDDAVVSPCGCDARLCKLPWPRFHFVRWRKFRFSPGFRRMPFWPRADCFGCPSSDCARSKLLLRGVR